MNYNFEAAYADSFRRINEKGERITLDDDGPYRCTVATRS